ncbi:MAG: T9SS type B sorting domain-containing protein [Saprospiraceae bacterium]|nr:T9SS type B sorting domain-containing protein [Saprospiraceae bacterium]
MTNKKYLIYLLLFFSNNEYLFSQSNEGTEFWFAFLQHRDPDNKKKCIITSKYNTSGTIEMPSTGWKQSFNVIANDVFIVDVPNASELQVSELITQQGVRVTTTRPSSVYIHHYQTFRADAALVLPIESLGTYYYVMTYQGYENEDDHYPSEFCIIGIENNTNIELTFSANTSSGKKRNEKNSIVLDRGETYQVQAATLIDDLSGTYVESDKPISLFSGNRWTQIPNGTGNRDNLLEQMYPVEVWGKQFVTIPSKHTLVDRYRIIASQDNTIINFSGAPGLPGSFTVNKGKWVEFELRANSSFVQASAPIMIAQFLVGGDDNGLNGLGDPSMVLLNSVEQMRDTVTIYNSPYENITRQFVNVLTATRDTSNLMIDGQTVFQSGNGFQLIGPKNEFALSQMSVTQGPHVITSGGCGVIAIAYGYGFAESYAYGGGANFYKFNKIPIPDGSCLNDSIEFKSSLPPGRFDVKWDLGDGTIISSHQFKYIYKSLGNYNVKLVIHDLCLNVYDSTTKEIQITLRKNLIAYPDTLLCEGSSVQLMAQDISGSQYKWEGPNRFSSDIQNPTISNVTKLNEGTYTVTGIYFGCATYPRFIELEVSENPKPNLGKDTFFCPEYGTLQIGVTNEYDILWDNGSTNRIREIDREGIYSVTLTNEYNCFGIDTIEILEKCPLIIHVPNIFSPNGDNINDIYNVIGSYIEVFKMEIFTRWGEKVFVSTDINKGWNGLIRNGPPANPGVYVCIITAEGFNSKGEYINEVIKNDLTLLR